MPQLTLTRAQFTKLDQFCKDQKLDKFFLAKDDGAYVGASAGDKGNCIFYFKGCDPKKDADYYDTARRLFGGDDFGIQFDAAFLSKIVNDPLAIGMEVKVSSYRVAINAVRKRVPA